MKTTEKIELLRDLCQAFGPSGCEDAVRERILEEGKKYCSDYTVDRMGNLVFHFSAEKAGHKKLMMAAHMDEVGFMVNRITDEGYLKFTLLGGIDERVLCGRNVKLGDEKGQTDGVIASKAIHHQTAEERKKITPVEDMVIDIGAVDKAEAERRVPIGSFGTFDGDFCLLGGEKPYLKSKALDDRLGCAVMLLVMEKISRGMIAPTCEADFCFTVREELGLSGAQVTARRLCPDYAIVLETTAIADIPGTDPSLRVADTGAGGVLSLVDRSTIYDRTFVDFALSIAKKDGIPVQIKRFVSGGNDAGHIQRTGNGVKCLALSAPTRYLHSPACMAAFADYEAMEALVGAILADGDFERKA